MKSIPFPSGLPCPGLVALQVLCALGRAELPGGVTLGGEEQWGMNFGCGGPGKGGDLEPFEANSMGCLIELEIWSLERRVWLWVVAQ